MWQVGLGKVRTVALRFVGNGQGKAGLAGKASFVELGIGELRPGEAGWGGEDPVLHDPVGNGKSGRGLARQVR